MSASHGRSSIPGVDCGCTQAFAGGPLASKTGASLIAAGVPLYPWYGATEFGSPTLVFTLVTDPHAGPNAKTLEDWEWLEFGDYVNTRWEPQGDGTYELQYLVRHRHLARMFAGLMATDVRDASSVHRESIGLQGLCH